MKRIFTLSLLSLAGISLATLSAQRIAPLSEGLRPHSVGIRAEAASAHPSAKAPSMRVPDDGREYSTVLFEDFSKMTEGSAEDPSTVVINTPDFAIPPQYTLTPGWGGRGVTQAGGMACIGKYYDEFNHTTMTGQIETPPLDLTRDHGTAYVSFRAKPLPNDVDMLTIRWTAEADPLPISGEEQTVYIHGAAWQTVEVTLTECPENAVIQVWSEYNEWLIDDFKVEQFQPELDAPKALKWTDYTGDAFTANWSAVPGADHYILNCYYVRRQGTEDQLPNYKYVVKNLELTETSYRISGLDPEKVYYYYVRAVSPTGYLSEESQVVEVLALTVPGNITFGDVTRDGFMVSWDPVLNAEGYGFEAILDHTAQADEDYALIDEPFDVLVNGGSVGDVYVNTIGLYDMDAFGISRAGWVMYDGGVINGALALHNYVSDYGTQYYGELVSPIMSIGQTTGGVKISADFLSLDPGVKPYIQVAVPGVVDGVTKWVLGAGGEINKPIGSDWTHLDLIYNIPAGLVRFSIGTTDGGWLYLDNLRIGVDLPEGAVQRVQYHYNEINDGLDAPEYFCATPDRTDGDDYSVALMAARLKPGSWLFPQYITSDWSDLLSVPEPQGDSLRELRPTSTFSARAAGNSLVINNPDSEAVTVHDLLGRCIHASSASSLSLPLPAGIYIVSHNGKAIKISIK